MERKLGEFCRKVSGGPAFLLLGQDYLRLESGEDKFLAQVLKKYNRRENSFSTYEQIFEGEAGEIPEGALAWMQKRCELFPIPEWLTAVADFPWSGVYTSAIDVVWLKAFRKEWREIQPVLEEKYEPIDPRNRTKLHCTFLFGNVERSEESERPPLTKFEYLKRKQVAVSLARRLPEIVTPLGVVAIEGYAFERDWLSLEDLVPILDELGRGQTHIFSVTEKFAGNEFISNLVRVGKIVLHSESLSLVLLKGQDIGVLEPVGLLDAVGKRHIQINDRISSVPTPIWNRVSRSAVILDESVVEPLPRLSQDRNYQEFRNFLAESGLRPVWSGYGRNHDFAREFQNELKEKVKAKLQSGRLRDEPIIIHGQTGTGKTVALGRLAYDLKKERKHPVLFIERRSQKPLGSDIDTFCQWAEDCGADSTAVIWDGMAEVENYYELLHYLVSRGRKVVLVGSCYLKDEEDLPKASVNAPAALTRNEISQLKKFLGDIDSELPNLVNDRKDLFDDSFLVALFRVLPPSRARIRSGVEKEVDYAERKIRVKSLNVAIDPGFSTLAYALLEAGLIEKDKIFSPDTYEIAGESVNKTQELMALVMVPGQFGLKVPVELLMRAIGRGGLVDFTDLIADIDILRWIEDSIGNIFIGPRTTLEAKLIVQGRLGGARSEIEFAKRLIHEVKDDSSSHSGSEIEFAIELLRNMGPNMPQREYFAPYFLELSETLRTLREKRGIQNSRLMLQEAVLLREFVSNLSQCGSPPDNAKDLLNRAYDTVLQAVDITDRERRNIRFLSTMTVELASILSTKARYVLDCGEKPEDSLVLFKEARDRIFEAKALDPENFYPVDVLSWTTRDLLGRPEILDDHTRSEIEADILHMFAVAENEDLGAVQRERFNMRRYEIGRLLRDSELSERAFEDLVNQGSAAGYYLKSYSIVKDVPADAELTDHQRKVCLKAVGYLESKRNEIRDDSRCSYLLLRLWWLANVGKPMFYRERQTLAFDREQWSYLLGLSLDLLKTEEFFTNPVVKYLEGIVTFHLGHTVESFDIFRELERNYAYVSGRRRLIRSFLASLPDGAPRQYDGTVARISLEKRRGDLYVPELRRHVSFVPTDFGMDDARKGQTVSFHLAFNFIGPIADPITRYQGDKI